MIVYRFCAREFSKPSMLLNGIGASLSGRRWNGIGTRATYCGTIEELCVAEIGYYTVISQVDFILMRLSLGKAPTQALVKQSTNQPFIMSKIEITRSLKICDLTDGTILSSMLSKYGLPNYSINDYRKSPYALLNNQWTQSLGNNIFSDGYDAILAKSARHNSGKVMVLFPRKLLPSDVKILDQKEYQISAIDSGSKKISLRSKPCRTDILCEDPTKKRTIINVQEFPI